MLHKAVYEWSVDPALNRKGKGDLAEMKVACDLLGRGYKIAFPYGEDWDYDLILRRGHTLERMQVKYTRSDGVSMEIRCYSHSLTNGKVRATKRYTAGTIDWLAAYDVTTDRCYYLPAALLGPEGRRTLTLRVRQPKNHQAIGVRYAGHYRDLGVEPAGLEPATSSVQGKRSSS